MIPREHGVPPLRLNISEQKLSRRPALLPAALPVWESAYPAYQHLPRHSKWAVDLTYALSLAEAETVFYSYVSEVTITCPKEMLVAENSDTGRFMCVSTPYNLSESCLVYSVRYHNLLVSY